MKKLATYFKWFSLLVFVILLRVFLFEVYIIPSKSMLNTLKPGDVVLASKIHFGTRLGDNNNLWRSPRLSEPSRGQVVIFNFPEADTVYAKVEEVNYHEQRRKYGKRAALSLQDKYGPLISNAIINRTTFIKRLVALPGDTFQMKNDSVFINGVKQVYTDHILSNAKTQEFFEKRKQRWKNAKTSQQEESDQKPQKKESYKWTFPHQKSISWNDRFFGPLVIPKKGMEVEINLKNIHVYEFIIRNHEGHDLKVLENQIFIDDKLAHVYEFEKDYYFVLGDNRANSVDSRFWGFLPDDHLKAKAVVVLFSYQAGNFSDWLERLMLWIQ